MSGTRPRTEGWSLPEWAAAVFAVAPIAGGGVFLRGPAGPEIDAWTDLAREASGLPWTRVGPSVALDHLTGALDVEASLASGAVRRRTGLLEKASGAVVEVHWPALLPLPNAQALARTRGRTGIVVIQPTGPADEEEVWPGLVEPVAVWLAVPARWRPTVARDRLVEAVVSARGRWKDVVVSDALMRNAVEAAERMGVVDVRTMSGLICVTRIVGALNGETDVGAEAAELALALVVMARPGAMVASPEEVVEPPRERPAPEDASHVEDGRDPEETHSPPSADPSRHREAEAPATPDDGSGPERLVEAAEAWLPPDVLAARSTRRGRSRTGGDGARKSGGRTGGGGSGRGRTLRVKRGRPGHGSRLHLLETLRAAAPRQGEREAGSPIRIRPADLRVRVIERRQPATVIFAVDASGSQAVARLGEVKGAVELLLSDSYRRRDHVALVVFREDRAELVLPPTRSLTRVRRAVSGLPGGGGTPLAHGLTATARTADSEERMGRRPMIVLLTDGRPNVAMGEGRAGREHAREDALLAARAMAHRGWPALLVDSSRRPRPFTDALAEAMGARLIRLAARTPEALKEAVSGLSADAGPEGGGRG